MKDKVVLIGMPGCGKTTIGKVLAEDFKISFYDMDDYIEKISNSTIKDLFGISEEHFRSWETKACKELAQKKKSIISSGGGVVEKDINIDILKKECFIVFINRDVEDIIKDIDSTSRPLLKDGKDRLYKLYNARFNKYQKASDVEIINKGDISDVINKIKKAISDIIR